MSAPPPTCSRCGSPLTEADAGCPRCLLELGRAPRATEGTGPEAGSEPGRRPRARALPSLEELARRFPELEIEECIGVGGMGAVYRARQPRIERTVALKILALDPGDDPTFAERFRREAIVLARLDHPSIVKLHDFGERDGLFFLLLEHVDGANLRALMKQGLLAPAQALAIVPRMCEALQYAHDEGVVHRDIKPENVLIDAKGRVKIADFGLAKLVDPDERDVSLTEVDQIVGTPHYMAPEQLRGSREVDHRADIYSLGVVLYEMLTGELPRGNFELPSRRVQVDVRLDEIVLKSLERTPERRYQHAVEVKTDVEGLATRRGRADPSLVLALGTVRRADSGRTPRIVIHPGRPWEFMVTYLILWPLVGLAFDAGVGWFTAALVLVAATFWSQVERAIEAVPELAAALAQEARGRRALRHLAALLLIAGGLAALAAGHVAVFPNLSPSYRAGPEDPAVLHSVDELLARIDARAALATSPSEVRGAGEVWQLDTERAWHSPWLLLLAPVLLLGAAEALSSKRGIRRGGDLVLPLQALGTALGALALLEGVTFLLGVVSYSSGPLVPVLEREAAATADALPAHGLQEASRRLRLALVGAGYQVTAEGRWNTGASTASSTTGELEVVLADPASPFDRWHLGWAGPRRVAPHAIFVLRGAHDSGPVSLQCDLGDAPVEASLRKDAREWLARTLAAARAF